MNQCRKENHNKNWILNGNTKKICSGCVDLRLIDDDFMAAVFEDRTCAEFLLQIILKRDDLTVKEVHGQYSIKNLQGRSIRLDILAVDQKNRAYNIEVQRSDRGASEKRARYNSSLLDANLTDAGDDYDTLNKFLTIKDKHILLYEHNAFTSHLMLDSDEVYQMTKRGLDAAQIAVAKRIHLNLVMVKLLELHHILWAGVALMLLSVLLTLFTSMANDGSVWDFAYLTEQVIKNNMSMIFPMCISLIAGYMISREQTDDTLKNILTVPISFKKLLTGKLIVCGVLSIIFGLICSLFTIIAEMIVGFPGFEISLALKAALQITAVNFFLYLAVLPIIALTCRRAGSFLVGVIIAFVYGYGGMFAAGNMTLANLYPITASLGMVGYRSYDTAVNWNIGTCSCSLVLAVVISAILILCMKEREATQTKKKPKKVAPKKGW